MKKLTTFMVAILIMTTLNISAAAAQTGDVRISTEVNGQFVELYFPAGSEAAVAYNRDVKPLLPNGIGRMSDSARKAMEAWKNKYASSSGVAPQAPITEPQPQTLTAEELKALTDTMFELVNQEREKAGLRPLARCSLLDEAAMIRAAEIKIVDDAGGTPHTRPDGTSYRTLLDEMGINSRRCGENISRARATPQESVNALMLSDGHRANILRENYGSIGIGVYQRPDGNFNWIQIFQLR